jgi:hypothetical protein
MGSVQSNITCPNCQSEDCFEDSYYKTGEHFTHCPECGYYHALFYKRDDNGNLILADKSKASDYNNLIPQEVKIDKPYCAYCILHSNGAGQAGTITDKKEFDDFVAMVKEIAEKNDGTDNVTISRFVKGQIIKETLYQNPNIQKNTNLN